MLTGTPPSPEGPAGGGEVRVGEVEGEEVLFALVEVLFKIRGIPEWTTTCEDRLEGRLMPEGSMPPAVIPVAMALRRKSCAMLLLWSDSLNRRTNP